MESELEIILVEDNSYDAEMTIRAMNRSHLINKIVHLVNGVELLDFLHGLNNYSGRNTSIKPKLILLDIKMPKMDGIEVLQKLKSDNHTKSIPVVMLTSSKEDPDIRKCYELGANSYIVKPVGFENFSKAILDIGIYWVALNQPNV